MVNPCGIQSQPLMPRRLMHKSPENWHSFPGRAEPVQQDSVNLPTPHSSLIWSSSSMVFVQKRVNRAGLERTVCKLGPWPASGDLDFVRKVPTWTDETGSLTLNCTNNVVHGKNLLSFWESGKGWLLHTMERLPVAPAPSWNLGYRVSNKLSSRHFIYTLNRSLLEEQAHPAWSHWERALEAWGWFPLYSAPGAFSFGWFFIVSFCCNKSKLQGQQSAVSCGLPSEAPCLKVCTWGPPRTGSPIWYIPSIWHRETQEVAPHHCHGFTPHPALNFLIQVLPESPSLYSKWGSFL